MKNPDRATDRINSSWDSFIVKQDTTVQAMATNGLDFADIIEGMAVANGIGTVQMAEQMAAMGVAFGDTMGLIEAVGREKVNSVVSDLARIAAAAKAAKAAIDLEAVAADEPRELSGIRALRRHGVGPGQGGPGDDLRPCHCYCQSRGQGCELPSPWRWPLAGT